MPLHIEGQLILTGILTRKIEIINLLKEGGDQGENSFVMLGRVL